MIDFVGEETAGADNVPRVQKGSETGGLADASLLDRKTEVPNI